MEKDQLYIEALKLLLEQTDKEYTDADAREHQVRELLSEMSRETEALRAKRATIQAELAGLLMKPSADLLSLPMGAEQTPNDFRPMQRRRAWKNRVVEMIEMMLSYGRMTTDEIFSNLQTHGVDFEGIASPRHRVVQILSESPQFESDRTRGWGLKSAQGAMTTTGAGSAAVEEEEEL